MLDTSENFNTKSGNDIVLISSDQIRFIVPTANFINSKIFTDMIQLCGTVNKEETIELTETAQVLEIILPYLYSDDIKEFKLEFPACFPVVFAFHKYEINRGLAAIREAFHIALSNEKEPKTISCQAFSFATLVNSSSLARSAIGRASKDNLAYSDMEIAEKMETCDAVARKEFVYIVSKRKFRAVDLYVTSEEKSCGCSSGSVPLRDAWKKIGRVLGSQGVTLLMNLSLASVDHACGYGDGCSSTFTNSCTRFIAALEEVEGKDIY